MKKDIKKLYVYALIMTVCVIVIVLIALLSESRIDSYQNEYEGKLTARQSEIQKLEKEIAELEDKNYELEKKEKENKDVQAKFDKYVQTMNDLTGIYKLIEEEKSEEAREQFFKIETSGFDNAELAYYEIIKNMLKN